MNTSTAIDPSALHRIGYGLYVLTVNDGKKDNGLIVNTVTQVASKPLCISVAVSKSNYSAEVIRETEIMNVNCLTTEAPFSVFERFGFQSGRDTDKFAGLPEQKRSANGLIVLSEHVNAVLSLRVKETIDLDSHLLFLCEVTESAVLSKGESMTYAYYHANVKPKKPAAPAATGYVCKICGWVYEGATLPDDLICPICKHGKEDFVPLST